MYMLGNWNLIRKLFNLMVKKLFENAWRINLCIWKSHINLKDLKLPNISIFFIFSFLFVISNIFQKIDDRFLSTVFTEFVINILYTINISLSTRTTLLFILIWIIFLFIAIISKKLVSSKDNWMMNFRYRM